MQFISPGLPQFKANLHSHSNLSDGRLTPESMAEAYQARGYSVLAITDHEAPYDHSRLSTPDLCSSSKDRVIILSLLAS